MASSFRLKRKLYSSDTEGSSFGKKALAVGGTLAATAGAFYGARKGMFGNTARQMAGKAWAKAGKAVGSDSMMKSGVTDYGIGRANAAVARANKIATAQGKTATNYTKEQIANKADKYGYQLLGKLMN